LGDDDDVDDDDDDDDETGVRVDDSGVAMDEKAPKSLNTFCNS
jgi:hypothetical protein